MNGARGRPRPAPPKQETLEGTMPNHLKELIQYGQSFWYDNIRRSLLTGGGLKRMVEEDGLRGMTSNPTIFGKAISGSADYDATIGKSLDLPVEQIFIELALEDIKGACDVLRPVYDSSGGRDGFVSMEVFPDLARDAAGTLEQVRLFWKRIARPNVMIKIPSTPECIPAIRQALREGININITLMFGFNSYRDVVEAYLSALEERVAKGEPIDKLASVASLFVSRVDTKVDNQLEEMARAKPKEAERLRALQGKAGIANARRMYQYFLEITGSERFQKLAAKGAQKQRLLWASTSTKDPRYPDTLYADALVGPDTVDTMPDATIAAFRDHGNPADRLTTTGREAEATLKALAAAGIEMDRVLDELQDEGVDKFQESFDELMQCLRDKTIVLKGGGAVSMRIEPGSPRLNEAAQKAIKNLEKQGTIAKLWQKDATAWTHDPAVAAKVSNRLGWLHITEMMLDHAAELREFAHACRADELRQAVLLGMGGSSLAPEVLRKVFGVSPKGLELIVLDTTDPDTIAHVDARLDLAHTLFIVSSKSGGTIEPNSLFAYFWERVRSATANGRDPGSHFIAITDEGTTLQRLAREHNFRRVFTNPGDIGGRYSALSYFGLVPAALIGVEVEKLLKQAEVMLHACASCVPAEMNPGAQLGALIGALQKEGRDKLTLLTPPELKEFGLWLEQLVAESTGKQGTGIIPVAGEPAGPANAYGSDRIFVSLRLGADDARAGEDRTTAALQEAGHPVVTIGLRDRYDLGQEFFRWEFAIAVAGAVLGINPFDEPNVQESKDNTSRVIEAFVRGGARDAGFDAAPQLKSGGLALYSGTRAAGDIQSALADYLEGVHAGDYVALMTYFEQTPERDSLLERLRVAIRDHYRVATTLGYGPRFLHSTGQLHKGGPNTGVFVQLTAAPGTDLKIPGQPYSFATLFAAQALGDYQSLEAHKRRVVRLDLGKNIEAGLQQLLAWVAAAAGQPA
jgi:transaldolase/glucose-6-phosphate isomerase